VADKNVKEETVSVELVKRLEEQWLAAKEAVKKGFLTTIDEALGQLKAIGFEYELRAIEGLPAPKNGTVCSKCGGRGHNARGCKQEVANGKA
jgi:hypothetical protein